MGIPDFDIRRITDATSLDELYTAVRDAGIVDPGRRFVHLELDITSRCNIRCVMCYHSLDAFARRPVALLTPERFDAMAVSVLPYARTLTLSLGSEPTTSPHFMPILRSAAAFHVPSLTFFTNATLFDDRLIEAILDAGVTEVCVSIDGATASTYEAIRRGAAFEKVIGNVRRLIAARNARASRIPRVRLDLVMMKQNVHELPAFVELAASIGADAVNFFHMVSYVGLRMEDRSLRWHQDLSDLWLRRAIDKAAVLGVAIASHPRAFADARESAADAFADMPYCRYPFFHISMNSGGDLMPCPFSHGEAPYGTASAETSIETIWLGPRFSELRRRILEHDPPEMCRRCSYLASRYPSVDTLFEPRSTTGSAK